MPASDALGTLMQAALLSKAVRVRPLGLDCLPISCVVPKWYPFTGFNEDHAYEFLVNENTTISGLGYFDMEEHLLYVQFLPSPHPRLRNGDSLTVTHSIKIPGAGPIAVPHEATPPPPQPQQEEKEKLPEGTKRVIDL